MVKTNWLKLWACMVMCVFALGTLSVPMGAMAQTHSTTTHTKVKKKNIMQRHPNATGVVAGVAAYKLAKKTGNKRAAHGGKKNFAQRHPVLTGVAAGMAARKMAKKTGEHKR